MIQHKRELSDLVITEGKTWLTRFNNDELLDLPG
jgi:SNF2 family DNA or RNA helicase